ncbi:ABC transporter substrate-binding protein [Propionivibrio sp.]|uniref:ABC transporter substrate-binding protein n=1 Tax=Propionivibrio sp. TaxID=2212460 RepID=UPI0039E59AFE
MSFSLAYPRGGRLLALLSILLLPAVAGAAGTPKTGGTLQAIVQPEPVTLTGAVNTAQPTSLIATNIYDGLVSYDNDLKPEPQLAERWEVAKNGLSITFHLRKDVKWHDGQRFTSADVKWSVENVWKTVHPRNKALLTNLIQVDTPDSATAILRFSKPSLALLSTLNSWGGPILPRHLYENTDILSNPYNNKPVGTGPFVFKEWVRGSHITLERNSNYWDKGKPYLDRIIFKVVPDAGTRAVLLETGEAQYAVFSPVPPKEAQRLRESGKVAIETNGYQWSSPVLYLDYNLNNTYLKDVRVRRAIAHAVDLDALGKVVWYGYGKPPVSVVPSSLKQFHDASVPRYPFDPKKAEALLDEAGYPRNAEGVRFSISDDFLPYGEDYRRTAEFLKQSLKRVGIDVELRSQDTASFTRRVYGDRDFDTSISWNISTPDPQIGLTRMYWSGWIGKNVPWTNASGYNNPEVDRIIEQAQGAPTQSERAALFKRFQQITQAELPTLPLLELHFFTVHSTRLKGVDQEGDQATASLKNAWIE